MRVHPSQLSNGILPFFGPSTFWVKSFNLNNKKIVFPVCVLFLFSVIGSALTSESMGKIKYKLTHLTTSNAVGEPLAIVLSNAESKIFLLSAPIRQSVNSGNIQPAIADLELSITDKVFLEASLKYGTLAIEPLSDAADLPLLQSRSLKELKELVALNAAAMPVINYDISSRVFVPGQSEIYGITSQGQVVEIGPDGSIVESMPNTQESK
jgi:hypothetical protein